MWHVIFGFSSESAFSQSSGLAVAPLSACGMSSSYVSMAKAPRLPIVAALSVYSHPHSLGQPLRFEFVLDTLYLLGGLQLCSPDLDSDFYYHPLTVYGVVGISGPRWLLSYTTVTFSLKRFVLERVSILRRWIECGHETGFSVVEQSYDQRPAVTELLRNWEAVVCNMMRWQ